MARAYELPYRLGTLGFKHHMVAAPLEDRLEWLKRQGYFVLPSSLIEEGGAPMLIGQCIKAILPNDRAKNGSRPVKGVQKLATKKRRTKKDRMSPKGTLASKRGLGH